MAKELGVNKHMASRSGCFRYSCTSGRDKGGPSQRLWEVLRAGPRVVPGRRYQPGAVPPRPGGASMPAYCKQLFCTQELPMQRWRATEIMQQNHSSHSLPGT